MIRSLRIPNKVTDEDITAVKESGLSEDQIFELIICAAFGQATRQYDAGIEALDAAMKNERDKHAADYSQHQL